MVHLGRYGYPDERNFVTNLLPPMTFLLNWKFLRNALFYGFFPFFTTFFNSSQLHPLFPDLFYQIVWTYFYRIFRHFFFDFFEPDPLKPCHMFNWSSRSYDRNGTKNFKIGQELSDLWPKEGFSTVYHFSCMYLKTHFCGHRPNYWCIGVDMDIQTTGISSRIYCHQWLLC